MAHRPRWTAAYLSFRGTAREAMEFYRDVFGGELTTATFADFHASEDPSEDHLVMHADLRGPDGIRLMGSDVPNRMDYQPGTHAYSVSLSGGAEDEDRLRRCFERLAEGGTVQMPLEKARWGDTFGMCVDRFGITWQVNTSAQRG